MAKLFINFGDVKAPEPVPAGAYRVKIKSAAEAEAKSTGNPMIKLSYEILAPEEYAGRVIFDNLTFTQASLWRVKQALLAFGWDEDFEDEVDPDELIGQVADLEIVIRKGQMNEDTGEPYPDSNSVKRYHAAGDLISGTVANLLGI